MVGSLAAKSAHAKCAADGRRDRIRTMSSGGEPITKCPVCRYDLTGLPKNHRCPECGFEYDETMRVWLGHRLPVWAWILPAAYSLSAVAFAFLLLSRSPRLSMLGHWEMARYTLFAVLWIVVLRVRRSRVFIIVGKGGLCWRSIFGKIRQKRWPDIVVESWQGGVFDSNEGIAGRRLRVPLYLLSRGDREAALGAICDHCEIPT